MRGGDEQSGHLFSYLSPEQRVPADHPLRAIRTMTDEALRRLSPRFETMYAKSGGRVTVLERSLEALQARRDGLAQAIANEAPEEVMGVIEAANRGQLDALDKQIREQSIELMNATKESVQDFQQAWLNARVQPVTIPYRFEQVGPGLPTGDAPEFASTGGLVTDAGIQRFARGGVVLPFLRRGTDSVPAMLTPGELVLNAAQQRNVGMMLQNVAPAPVDLGDLRLALDDIRRVLARQAADGPRQTATLVKSAIQTLARWRG